MNKLDFNIFLIGFMGSGKSTIAKQLKKELDMELVEMDQRIVDEQGMSINDIFAQKGEEEASIISCGGGVVIRPQNVENMKKSGKIVFLTASPETILERVKGGTDRPLLNGNMNVPYIKEMMDKRRDFYEGAADIKISTDNKSVKEISAEIIEALK